MTVVISAKPSETRLCYSLMTEQITYSNGSESLRACVCVCVCVVCVRARVVL